MDYFTIGFVSGLIAAVVAIVQFIVPNALVILLVSVLSDKHSGVTWSVVGRALSSSEWPVFLRSDQTAFQTVSWRVSLVTGAKPLILLLIAVAAIVTPIGLYETIEVAKDLEHVAFSYIPDKGPMGLGTLLRNDLGFSRVCDVDAGLVSHPCPGSNGSFGSDDYRISRQLIELYQSGLASQSSTVSSFFDIQARLYQIKGNDLQSKDLPGNLSYLIDVYRPLTTLILDDRLQAVEGLVVDTQHPKIGFRNHTAPINVQYGAEWDEDLLFLEPETKCIDLNISVLFFLNEPYVYKLVDKGGFVNMNITSPWKARIGKDIWYDGIQESPALDWRAQATGWSVNFLLAHYFNIIEPKKPKKYINSWPGREFPAIIDMAGGFAWDNQIDLINDYSLLGNMDDGHNSSFNIVPANFTALRAQCDGSDVGVNVGVDEDDSRQHDAYKVKANIANIQIKCGLVMGTARPTSGDNSLIPKDLDPQERPIYSCASTTKAVIKTVRFRYNSTKSDRESMNGLDVLNIVDKVYNSRNERPLWGVEDVNMSIPHVNPLWGLIGPSWEKSVNLSTVRAERLYLPAGRSLLTNVNSYDPAENNDFNDNFSSLGDFTPAITGPGQAWRFVYKSKQSRRNKLPDYSGSESLTLSNKWDHLSHTAEGAAQILNLIFTDYTANMLTGTRSQLTINNLPLNEQKATTSTSEKKNKSEPGQVSVHLYHRIIRYRWVYGIPAFVSLLLVALIVIGAGGALLTNKGSIKRVKHYLWNLSAGRILTTFIYPRSGHMQSDTKEWIRAVGAKNVRITHGDPPRAGSPDIEVEADSRPISTTTSFQMVTQDDREELEPNDALELRSISRGGKPLANHEESTAASTQALIS